MQLNEQIKALRNYNKALHTSLTLAILYNVRFIYDSLTTHLQQQRETDGNYNIGALHSLHQASSIVPSYNVLYRIGIIHIHYYPHQNGLY